MALAVGKIVKKLEEVVHFRVGANGEKHKIVLQPHERMYATDGISIYLPQKESLFSSEKDNERFIADTTAHESDHIHEYKEFFGGAFEELFLQEKNIVQEYLQKNFSELKENPALAGWIDNIVKDRRIDAQRREQLPGSKRVAELLDGVASYLRPSTHGMSELDAVREQYLQKALLGKTLEPVQEKYQKLLEEIVKITNTAESIEKDKEAVTGIYNKFKENFDITQPISKLPPMPGRSDQSQTPQPQQGYGGQTQPREGRDEGEKRPKSMNENYDGQSGKKGEKSGEGKMKEEKEKDKGKKKDKNKGDKDKNEKKNKGDKKEPKDNRDNGCDLREPEKERERDQFYREMQETHGMHVHVLKPDMKRVDYQVVSDFRNEYTGEIESMKRVFRRLRLKHYGEKRDFHGQDLDYEEFMQSDLEQRVTGVSKVEKYFKAEIQNRQRAAFGIHADISGSTRGNIIQGIKAALCIVGNALSASDHQYGLYASSDDLYVIKAPDEKWSDGINGKIASLTSLHEGIYFHKTSSIIADDIKRVGGNPRGLIIISDFELNDDPGEAKKLVKSLYDAKIYPLLIAIGEEHEGNARMLTEDLGHEFYSVVPVDKLYTLPQEMFRLFKAFGVAR